MNDFISIHNFIYYSFQFIWPRHLRFTWRLHATGFHLISRAPRWFDVSTILPRERLSAARSHAFALFAECQNSVTSTRPPVTYRIPLLRPHYADVTLSPDVADSTSFRTTGGSRSPVQCLDGGAVNTGLASITTTRRMRIKHRRVELRHAAGAADVT